MSLLLYNVFLWTYAAALRLVSPWNPKARRWLSGRVGLMDTIRQTLAADKRPTAWMHCASLGEFEQGRPVLEALRTRYPHYRYVLTFFSPSGYESAKNYPGADHVFYLPADSPRHAAKLLDILQPSLVLWVKYDYWYYYLRELRQRDIPVLMISAVFRPRQAFFRWYGSLQRAMLRNITHFFVQNEESLKLLFGLGIPGVTISGDTRFDRVISIAEGAGPIPGIDAFCGNHPVIVAGSTWQEDEEELDHFANTHPDIRFIIAPHEVDEARLGEVEKLFKHTIRYSRYLQLLPPTSNQQTPTNKPQTLNHKPEPPTSNPQPPTPHNNSQPPTPNVLIIDNIGLLSRLYRYATITWVGGGFGSDGVHNVLEAAVYGKPVVYGPVYEKYVEAIELAACGGGFPVDNALEAESLFTGLLENEEEYRGACEAARNYVYSKQGATEAVVAFIQEKRLLTS